MIPRLAPQLGAREAQPDGARVRRPEQADADPKHLPKRKTGFRERLGMLPRLALQLGSRRVGGLRWWVMPAAGLLGQHSLKYEGGSGHSAG
jgi:hypothetical protein